MAPDPSTVEVTDAPFTIRSLIGEAGVGSNGEKLVSAIQDYYPEELQRAQLLKPNVRLSEDLALAGVAKIVGDGVDVRDAVVRGGELRDSDAWVTYAGYNDDGDTVKGAFRYDELGKRTVSSHVSQVDSLQQGTAARDHAIAEAKRKAAESGAPVDGDGPVDPIGQYEDMKATEVVAYLDANPGRAEAIKALEVSMRGEDDARTTIMNWEPKEEAPEGDSGDGSGDDPPPAT